MNDGGRAFPKPCDECNHDSSIHEQQGMTLRDYFAAKAMQALISKINDDKQIAKSSYFLADAMLKERERE